MTPEKLAERRTYQKVYAIKWRKDNPNYSKEWRKKNPWIREVARLKYKIKKQRELKEEKKQ